MELNVVVLAALAVLTCAPWRAYSEEHRLLVDMTLVRNASTLGAFCLDGSLPAYHWHRGFGAGARNWLLQFEGGGWCNDVKSCLDRAQTRRGSTRYMTKFEVFSGILSKNASLNPDFYNWNRVKLRYCDGASFAGDSIFDNGVPSWNIMKNIHLCRSSSTSPNTSWYSHLYLGVPFSGKRSPWQNKEANGGGDTKPTGVGISFQGSNNFVIGQRIWQAIIHDLLPKGLGNARKALLSGCSAGGLATFLHCDNFTKYLPANARVKCLSDAGFFLDARDISLNHTMRFFFKDLVSLQCFFPQYALRFIETPFFILNSAYDVFQFHHGLVPPSADPHGNWNHCKLDPAACDANQTAILQGFRRDMIVSLFTFFENSKRGGMYINSCFAHCQSESQDTWFGVDSPRIHNKTIAQAVGDWYFSRRVTKEIDCAYPCDTTCHNLIPQAQVIMSL
ncbi:hypothetical protein TIFTF001_013781 [Ficus carica]|uniref:Pectin acetylesterase n=1 Tax=Ficus carica TaxID=3494 RepID=A0AA88AEX4_FICCA|nr:hypothetical protein TIFTF001_013781 [Ficus carica]